MKIASRRFAPLVQFSRQAATRRENAAQTNVMHTPSAVRELEESLRQGNYKKFSNK